MADVFISYANEDRERIRKLASALESLGWSVWWDRRIIAGQTFDQVIEHELETAKTVVVLWSKVSISSEWVKNEAAAAADRGVLVPALIDNVKPPLEFRRKQTANLIGWTGDPGDPGFQELCKGVMSISDVSHPLPRQIATPTKHRFPWKDYRTSMVVAGIGVALVLLVYSNWTFIASRGGFPGRGLKVEMLSTEGHGINNPLTVQPGVVHKITLDKNEPAYFRLAAPTSDLKVVLDTRRNDGKTENLQSSLSLLNNDGGPIEDRFIHFNEISVGFRKTAQFSQKRSMILGFKLLNMHDTSTFWLTAFTENEPAFVPFFGEVQPQRLGLDQAASGTLDKDEDIYYRTDLAMGDYKVIVDFANRDGDRTNIQGYLSLLDTDGGNQRELIRFNEIDVSYRKIAELSLRRNESLIMRITNNSQSINYTVLVTQNR